MNDFEIRRDLMMVQELTKYTQQELADKIKVGRATINRLLKPETQVSNTLLEKFYDFAFRSNIKLNKIKEQLIREEYSSNKNVILFHGAKTNIIGEISVDKSEKNNDFGKGFYCGETLEQSAMFVSNYDNSSLYILSFNKNKNLKSFTFNVDRDWMLAISYFRGKINQYSDHPIITNILKKLKGVDYIIAPIADNRMFEIIDEFIEGFITDIQCQHCLSSTNLGLQYVFVTEKATKHLSILQHCYLSNSEKDYYLKTRFEENKISSDKVKIAKKQYSNKGLYIEDILK